jgi:endonuclease YncB( thermonuclease family)
VRVVVEDTNRCGRTVGWFWAGALDIDAELVRRGAAWVYRQYNQDTMLLPLEAEARQAKRGLWALPTSEQVPPCLATE